MYETPFPLEVSTFGHNIRYSTDITVGKNGQEVRNANWQDALRSYNAGFGIRTLDDVHTLRDFFHSVRGRETAFLLKDYTDFKVTNQALNGLIVPDGARTQFQIFKVYQNALGIFIRRDITKPKTATTTVTTTPAAGAYTVSATTGIITFTTAPPVGTSIYVTTEFYVPARFDTDELPLDMLTYWVSGATTISLSEIPDVPLVEVRYE